MRPAMLASTLLLIPSLALAAAPPPPMGVWTGKGQLGVLASQGNTQAESANAALDMGLVAVPWKHALHLDLLYGKSANVVAAERWNAQWQSNYNFTGNLFTFGLLRYEHDLFSGFLYQGSATAGIGYQIFDTAARKLSVQVGAGLREERPEQLTKNPAGQVIGRVLRKRESGAILTSALNYTEQLTASTSLSDAALLESGAGNTMITNTLALAVKMSDKLALSIGYALQENTSPPAPLKQLDTTETVNLVYAF
jgi:putative salt-induced outer membrane protein